MKKITLVTVLVLLFSTLAFADLHSDLVDLWTAYANAVDTFATAMDAVTASADAGKVFDQFIQDMKPVKAKALDIEKNYPHGQGAQYEGAYAQEWATIRAADMQRLTKFSQAFQKLAMYAQNDPALRKSLQDSSKDLSAFRR